ncbi:DUF4181 domain-containing protein [Planococcus sp. 1R117A]|uniref:DUF4181 domain-containing protein n=1 Tax=Planococcus sp. 1R117A TaxID=3447020 RepID=UPI003EDBFBFB
MAFFLVAIALFALLFGLEMVLRKGLGIKKASLSDTPAKKYGQWGQGSIFIAVLISISLITTGNSSWIVWLWIVFALALQSFVAFLQWKYMKESKEHLLTLITIPVLIVLLLAIGSA